MTRPHRFAFLTALAVAIAALAFGRANAAEPDSSRAAPDSSQAIPDSSQGGAVPASGADSLRLAGKEFPHPDSTLVSRLRAGGYVIVFRHSITDWGQQDLAGENFEDRTAQRNLSKAGEAQAARIGKAIAALQIPIGTVLSSPMWRCRDTAQIAFGHHQPVPELFRRGPEYRAMRMLMLSAEPKEPKNMVLVTHQDLLIPIVQGLRRDELAEGDALVVKPLGEGTFEVLAQVTPEDWEHLAATAESTAVKGGKAAMKGGKTTKKVGKTSKTGNTAKK